METLQDNLPIINGILLAILLVVLIITFIRLNFGANQIMGRLNKSVDELNELIDEMRETLVELKLLASDFNYKMDKLNVMFVMVNNAFNSVDKFKKTVGNSVLGLVGKRKNKKREGSALNEW